MTLIAAALQVREVTTADASRLARLAECVGGTWNEARFAGSLAGTARGWVMEAEVDAPVSADPLLGEALRPALAAAILVQPAPDDWEVLDLAVAPHFQRQGLARHLLKRVASTARSTGAKRIVLEVREGNGRARNVYVAGGFAPIGGRCGYYAAGVDAPLEDAIVMALEL
jgi:ribosomal protein S18 acetylase RimI-like enzyme